MEDKKPDVKYEVLACKILVVLFSVLFGCVIGGVFISTSDPSCGWMLALIVPAGILDLAFLIATFKCMYKLSKGEELFTDDLH